MQAALHWTRVDGGAEPGQHQSMSIDAVLKVLD